jgi:ABC-2 type transport system ATP-binding protein
MQSDLIDIQNLTVMLGKGFVAINNLSLTLAPGKITGFIGPSGAGKTTLIRSIVGRQKISEGHIQVFGQPAGSAGLRARISYMTQETSVYNDLTVTQNLRYFGTMFGVANTQVKQEVQDILQTVSLTRQANHMVRDLSGGQKQRVSLAISLIGSPKLIVLDEPTVGLDPLLREQLWELFRQLSRQGTTIILSSHVMDEAERCDDLLLLRDGQLLAHDSPAKICEQTKTTNVEQAFLKLVKGHA